MRYRCPPTSPNDKDKRCPRCTKTLPLSEFGKQKNGKPTVYCKPCISLNFKTPNQRYAAAKCRAKIRDLEWSIPFDVFCEMIKQPCHYCGGELSETGASMDRKEHFKKGYTLDNVVMACKVCNWVRHDIFTSEEMEWIGSVIRQIRRKRGPDKPLLTFSYKMKRQKIIPKQKPERVRLARQKLIDDLYREQ